MGAKKNKKNVQFITNELEVCKKLLDKYTEAKFVLKEKAIDLIEIDAPYKVLKKTIEQLHKKSIKVKKISKTFTKLEYQLADVNIDQPIEVRDTPKQNNQIETTEKVVSPKKSRVKMKS